MIKKDISARKDQKEMEHVKEMLIYVYQKDEESLKDKSLDELNQLLKKLEKEKLRASKNPNSFFILKDLPPPKSYKLKTSSLGGVIIFCVFIFGLLLFGGMMFWLAFR